MLDTSFLYEQESFSPALMYSLTADRFIMTEMRHLHMQSELIHQLSIRQERVTTGKAAVEEQKQVDATAIDESHSQLEISVAEETPPHSKVTLFADCKIKRIQEEDDILAEIQKRCSSHCFSKVKEVFETLRQQNKILKHLESQLELNHKIHSNLLHYKEENDLLKAELQQLRTALKAKQEQKQKMKVLEQKNMNKQNNILKNEKNLLLKEKRIVEMKKKVQNIFEHVDRELQNVYSQIHAFTQIWKEAKGAKGVKLNQNMEEKVATIAELWCEFGSSFKSKLQ